MKLENSNRVLRLKEPNHEKYPLGPYIVWQEKGQYYAYGDFESLMTVLHPYEKLIQWMARPSGKNFIPHADTIIYLKDEHIKVFNTIDHEEWENTNYHFISNIEPIMKSAKKKEKELIKGEVKWGFERTILLIVIIALVIIFLCFSYVMFYD